MTPITVSFSGWWLLAAGLLLLWAWALTRSDEHGGYFPDFGRVLAVVFAAIVTVSLLAGAGIALLLR